ncbi:MAG: hypothetical protein ABJA98_06695 [Acidobacteriota bacterium]
MSKIVHLLCALALASVHVHAAVTEKNLHVLPANITAEADLLRQMAVMLRRSATFRQQCQRLDVRELRVQIHTDPLLADRPIRARSIIRRSESGGFNALVAISAFGDPTEWLAHEFEHIIEQLDGVRVPQLAFTGAAAWRTGEGMFETERARRIGRLVRHEVYRADRTLADATASIETGGRGD